MGLSTGGLIYTWGGGLIGVEMRYVKHNCHILLLFNIRLKMATAQLSKPQTKTSMVSKGQLFGQSYSCWKQSLSCPLRVFTAVLKQVSNRKP